MCPISGINGDLSLSLRALMAFIKNNKARVVLTVTNSHYLFGNIKIGLKRS